MTNGKRGATKKKKNAGVDFRVFFNLCFYFDRLQNGAHLYQRGSTDVWVAVASKCPLDPPLKWCTVTSELNDNKPRKLVKFGWKFTGKQQVKGKDTVNLN